MSEKRNRFHFSMGNGRKNRTGTFFERGVAALEYAVLIVVVSAALIGIARYFKASLGGQWRAAGDAFGGGKQFDPAATTVR